MDLPSGLTFRFRTRSILLATSIKGRSDPRSCLKWYMVSSTDSNEATSSTEYTKTKASKKPPPTLSYTMQNNRSISATQFYLCLGILHKFWYQRTILVLYYELKFSSISNEEESLRGKRVDQKKCYNSKSYESVLSKLKKKWEVEKNLATWAWTSRNSREDSSPSKRTETLMVSLSSSKNEKRKKKKH